MKEEGGEMELLSSQEEEEIMQKVLRRQAPSLWALRCLHGSSLYVGASSSQSCRGHVRQTGMVNVVVGYLTMLLFDAALWNSSEVVCLYFFATLLLLPALQHSHLPWMQPHGGHSCSL